MTIAPSLLNAPIGNLIHTFAELEKINVKQLHIDVMDGCFVPDMAFGPSFIKSIRPLTNMVFDVHLMLNTPERNINKFIDAGSDIITFHIEATHHAMHIIQVVKEAGLKVGISLNPSTPVSFIETLLPFIDQVLVMTINPGTENQVFIKEMIKKIEQLDELRRKLKYSFKIQVDGKIDNQTIGPCLKAGADLFVSGSFIFNEKNSPKEQIEKLNNILKKAR